MSGFDDTARELLIPCMSDLRGLMARENALHQLTQVMHEKNEILVPDAELLQLQSNLDAVLPHIKDAAATARYLALTCAIRSMTQGRKAALSYLVGQSINGDIEKHDPRIVFLILNHHRWFADVDTDALKDLGARHDPFADSRIAAWKALRIISVLGVGESADIPWLGRVVNTLAIPWMLTALERDELDCALVIEHHLYIGWLRRVEIVEHYKQNYALWSRPMYEAGLRLRKKLPPLKIAAAKRPVVGVFVHSAAWLAHVALMHRSFAALGERGYDIRLYIPQRVQSELEKNYADIGIPCTFLAECEGAQPFTPLNSALRLREQAQKDGVQVMIWLCLATGMSFTFGMGVAPRQVYWSMRSMLNTLVGPDEFWMAFNDPNETLEFQGKDWAATPVTMSASPAPDAGKVAEIRARYPGKIILGTLGREDKMPFPHFLNTICDVLQRNPNTVYLYTGRQDLPTVRDVFKARGLSDRAHFVGWVDTNVYAHAFDIYIDTWPMRSGVTLFNALEAKKPMMFFMGDHSDQDLSRLSFFFYELQERADGTYHLADAALDASFDLADGGRALLAFHALEGYHACIDRLIADPEYRSACGQAGRALYQHLISDDEMRRKVSHRIESALSHAKENIDEAA